MLIASRKPKRDNGSSNCAIGCNRNCASQSEQPQIERQDRSHQHDEADDVQDLDRGIKRGRGAHRMTQRAFLQGQEDRRAGCCSTPVYRNSTRLPSRMTYSMRASSGLLVWG